MRAARWSSILIGMVLVAAVVGIYVAVRPSADVRLGQGRILTASGVAYGGIVALNEDGSNQINLTPNTFNNSVRSLDDPERSKSSHPTVSNNGLIAFASNRDGTGYRIFVMDGDGGNVRQVTVRPDGADGGNVIDDRWPTISPDGTKIAFISQRAEAAKSSGERLGLTDVFVVGIDGEGLRQVTSTQVNTGGGVLGSQVNSVVWGPDSQTLAFRGVRQYTDGYFHQVLATIRADGSAETHLFTMDSPRATHALDWSRSGDRIVYSGDSLDTNAFYVIAAPGADASRAVGPIPESSLGDVPSKGQGTVRFSPDGEALLYTRGASTGELAMYPLDGSAGRTVASGYGRDEPLWWAAGSPVPTVARLVLSPEEFSLEHGDRQLLVITVETDGGEVISRAAASWSHAAADGSAPKVGNDGMVVASAEERTDTICATNAGIEGCTTLHSVASLPAEEVVQEPTSGSVTEEPPTEEVLAEIVAPTETPSSDPDAPTTTEPSTGSTTVATTDTPPVDEPTTDGTAEVPVTTTPDQPVVETPTPTSTTAVSTPTPPTVSITAATGELLIVDAVGTATVSTPSADASGSTTETTGNATPTVTPGETLAVTVTGVPGETVAVTIDDTVVAQRQLAATEEVVEVIAPSTLDDGDHALRVENLASGAVTTVPFAVAAASSITFGSPAFWTGFVILLGIFGLMIWVWRRRRAPAPGAVSTEVNPAVTPTSPAAVAPPPVEPPVPPTV